MHIEVIPASLDDKPLLQRMLELYEYDFSEFEGTDLDSHGCFGYPFLDLYWQEETRYPFIIRVDGKLAGFVLVNQKTYLAESTWAVSEFFIMRKYRRKGVGKAAAFFIFNRFPGKWEVHELQNNTESPRFWREIISEYIDGRFSEIQWHGELSERPIQCFDNTVHRLQPGGSQSRGGAFGAK